MIVWVQQVVEFVAEERGRPEKLSDQAELQNRVAAAQELALFAHRCRQGGFAGFSAPSNS